MKDTKWRLFFRKKSLRNFWGGSPGEPDNCFGGQFYFGGESQEIQLFFFEKSLRNSWGGIRGGPPINFFWDNFILWIAGNTIIANDHTETPNHAHLKWAAIPQESRSKYEIESSVFVVQFEGIDVAFGVLRTTLRTGKHQQKWRKCGDFDWI